MNDLELVQQVGDALVIYCSAIGTASVVVQSVVRPRWWTTEIGQHFFWYMAAMAAVLDLSAVRIIAGAALETPWFSILRLGVFASVPMVMTWRLAIQLRLRRWDKEHTDDDPATGAETAGLDA